MMLGELYAEKRFFDSVEKLRQSRDHAGFTKPYDRIIESIKYRYIDKTEFYVPRGHTCADVRKD